MANAASRRAALSASQPATRRRSGGTDAAVALAGNLRRRPLRSGGTGSAAVPLQLTRLTCEKLSELDPHALGLTYSFDADADGDPYSVTIRFHGRRVGLKRRPGPRDKFDVSATVDPVLPGSGLITVTARVSDIPAGRWEVVARPQREPRRTGPDVAAPSTKLPTASAIGETGWAPVVQVRAPGVRLGAWPALVGVGATVALATQALLAAHLQLPTLRLLLVSVIACLVGLLGAKAYYLGLHPAERRRPLFAGMCIQGFVLAAIGTLAAGTWATGVAVGIALDATAPGLMFGMTIGRFGCLLGGCCAGRPTASRWGLWSSDRRLGMRRIPTQLMEAALAGAIGVASLLIVWNGGPRPAGTVFFGAVAAYTLGRQLLFPLRSLARQTAYGRSLALAASTITLAGDLIGALAIR